VTAAFAPDLDEPQKANQARMLERARRLASAKLLHDSVPQKLRARSLTNRLLVAQVGPR
jgi:hypothetical protein